MQSHLPLHGVECSGNIEADPLFEDEPAGDWRLQYGSPAAAAGLDLSASFTSDRDGSGRTSPWSIGAYEKD
jgi:hypothetical protein